MVEDQKSQSSSAMSKVMETLIEKTRNGEVDIAPLITRFMKPELVEGMAEGFADELRKILDPAVKKKLADDIKVLKGSRFYIEFLGSEEPPMVIELVGLPGILKATQSSGEAVEEEKLPGLLMDPASLMDMASGISSGEMDIVGLIEEDQMKGVRMGKMLPLFLPLLAMASPTSLDTLQQKVMPGLMGRLLPTMLMGGGGSIASSDSSGSGGLGDIMKEPGIMQLMPAMMPVVMPIMMPLLSGMMDSMITTKLEDPEYRKVMGGWVEKENKSVLFKIEDSCMTMKFRKFPELGMDIVEGDCENPDLALEINMGGAEPKLSNFSMGGMARDVVTRRVRMRGLRDFMTFGKLILPDLEIHSDKDSTYLEMRL